MRSEYRQMRAWRRGVTLIELLITISIMAVLAAVAAPSLQGFINSSRAVSLTNELVASLNFARSEAVKRGVQVTLCKTADPDAAAPTCTIAGNWETGWLAFTDSGILGTVDGTDTRLRVKQPTGGSGTITGGSNFANFVAYLPSGVSQGNGGLATGTLTVCVGGIRRGVIISSTGRIRTDKGTC